MKALLSKACAINGMIEAHLVKLESLLLLGIRLWMANIFFMSGWNKLTDYLDGNGDSVLYLFEEIHPVPLLPAELAAPMGTAGEVVLGAMLAIGLMGRFAALGLLVMTIVIQLSLPQLNTHMLWGLLLAVIVVRGSGGLSVDALLKRTCSS